MIQWTLLSNPSLLFVPYEPSTLSSIYYTYNTTSWSIYNLIYSCLIILCLVIVFVTIIIFIKKLLSFERDWKKWLPEQKWVVSYCAFLILFMNPIAVVIILGRRIIFPPSLPFSTIVISSFGDYGTWIVWFCFAAPVMCRKQSPWIFYTPRILYCLIVFIFSVVLAIYDYSYLLQSSDIQLFASIQDWPTIDDVTYATLKIVCASLDCSLYVLWILQKVVCFLNNIIIGVSINNINFCLFFCHSGNCVYCHNITRLCNANAQFSVFHIERYKLIF